MTGDYNGDGRVDLAVAGADPSGQGEVEVLLGAGDGTFRAAPPISTGLFSPSSFVTGDFNGDGRTDLAVAEFSSSSGQGEVEVLLGAGDGTFRAAPPISTGLFSPSALVTGDYNGDGRVDLAVAGADPSGQGEVEVLLGAGDGTFRAAAPISIGLFSPSALVTGDFSDDGRVDLAVAGADPSGQGEVEVLLGAGDGTFRAAAPISTGLFSPSALVTGDYNGDGRVDLAVAGADPSGQGEVEVLLGAGDGTFRAAAPISIGLFSPSALVTGDFNDDGRVDLAVAGADPSGQGEVEVLLGAGDGTFRAAAPISTGLFSPSALVTGDYNGDGRPDLAYAAPSLQVALSLSNGEFAQPGELTGAVHDNPLVADPGDGSQDVFVVNQDGDILWRKGRPQTPGSYGPPITINPGDPSRDIILVPTRQGPLLASVDLRDDLIALYAYRGSQFVRVGSLATGAIPAQVVAGDLNGDGNGDLVVRNAGDGTASIYLGDGDGGFVRQADLPLGLGASDIALADLGGTGRLDLVVTNQVTGAVRVLPGNGDGTFDAPSVYPAGAGPYGLKVSAAGTTDLASQETTAGVAIGTFTRGGTIDLATINPGSNSLSVLAGLGGGALANPVPILTNTRATVVRTGDFDHDGVSDLAVLGSDGLTISLGDAKGGFDKAKTKTYFDMPKTKTYDVGPDPTGLTIADVNGDGIPDLLVGNGNGDVLVLLGDGQGDFTPYHKVDHQIALAVASSGANGQEAIAYAVKGLDQVAVHAGIASTPRTVGDRTQGVLDPGAVMLTDLNGGGIPDLVVANSGANNVLVYEGLGDGQYDQVPKKFPVGTDPIGITVADLNGDGLPDLVVANQGSNDVSILLGQGQGQDSTLTPGPRLKAGLGPTATVVRDVNGDNVPDVLVSDSQSNDVRVLRGVGLGFFNDMNPTTFTTGSNPGPLIVGDFTGPPGQLDLVTINAGSNTLTLIRDINGGNVVTESLSSGGEFPVAAVEINDRGGEVSDLLVANSDGHLALFLGGRDGLELSSIFEDPDLRNPTALAMDELGRIFGVSEGVAAAVQIILGLGADGVGNVFPGPLGPDEQQVSILKPLNDSMPALAETLLGILVTDNGTTDLLVANVTGSGTTDLLVANNGDGRLALFLDDRLALLLRVADELDLKTFEEPGLSNPTSLAIDGFDSIFGSTAGIVRAFRVVLGLGPGSGYEEEESSSDLPKGPKDEQVAVMQPLSPMSLGVIATLYSVTLEPKTRDIESPGGAKVAVLPNQSLSKGGAVAGVDGGSEPGEVEASPAPVVVAQASSAPVARFVTGLDEAFARTRLRARRGALFGGTTLARAPESTLRTLDALQVRWSSALAREECPGSAGSAEKGRDGVAMTSLVDAALQALGSERERPGAAKVDDRISSGGPVPMGRSALTLGMVSIGLAAVAWPVADLVRPRAPRRHH